MGWFWADAAPAVVTTPHPLSRSTATPPPQCPMHKSSAPPTSPKSSKPESACPYPLDAPSSTSTPSKSWTSSATLSKLNPLNYMPTHIPNDRAVNQTVHLPLEREPSTIPRGDGPGNWEYPSPQQMYNAMLRKGYTDTPQDAVESMVAVHNFLNEGAWAEIVEWERRFGRGLSIAWQECRRGESRSRSGATYGAQPRDVDLPEPRLVRFMGRPGEMTPKARILQALGYVYPAKFNSEPPFDRHDWIVQRHLHDGSTREVRYVIDYYSGPPEPTGEPVFYLDVRPAVDTPTMAVARMMRWGGDVWWKAVGGSAREREKDQPTSS